MASGHYLPSSSMDSSRHKSGEKGRVAFEGIFLLFVDLHPHNPSSTFPFEILH